MRYKLNENKELVVVEGLSLKFLDLAEQEFTSLVTRMFKPSQAKSAPTSVQISTMFQDLIFLFRLTDIDEFVRSIESGEAKKRIMKWNRKGRTYPLNRKDKFKIFEFFQKGIERASFQIFH